jgi:tetratricopeptide (TPR) repeat protein
MRLKGEVIKVNSKEDGFLLITEMISKYNKHAANYYENLSKLKKKMDETGEINEESLEDITNLLFIMFRFLHAISNFAYELTKNTKDLMSYALVSIALKELNNRMDEYCNKAEHQIYEHLIESYPDNYIYNFYYAIFLKNIQRDYGKANEFYIKSIKINPSYPKVVVSYAGFLLSLGNKKEGFDFLEKAENLVKEQELLLECSFYKYAHSQDEKDREESLIKIKELLISGIRLPGWNPFDNVKRAIDDNFECPELLETLAEVIVNDRNIEDLDEFSCWK